MIIVVGIGVLPNAEIAAEAGLAIENGALVIAREGKTKVQHNDVVLVFECHNIFANLPQSSKWYDL